MIRKLVWVFSLFLAVVASSIPVSAFNLNDLSYDIDGNFTASINFPNFVSLSVSLPKLVNLREYFAFCDLACGGTIWYDGLLFYGWAQGLIDGSTMPLWTQSGTNFIIDPSPLTDSIDAMLKNYGVSGDLTKTSFTGKLGSGGKTISGKLTITYSNISFDNADYEIPMKGGTFSITMSFKGSNPTVLPLFDKSDKLQVSHPSSAGGMSSLKTNILNLVSQMLKSIPGKGGLRTN